MILEVATKTYEEWKADGGDGIEQAVEMAKRHHSTKMFARPPLWMHSCPVTIAWDRRVVGFAHYTAGGKKSDCATIYFMASEQRGVGRILVDNVQNIVCKPIEVLVEKSNENAIGFYGHLGFKVVEEEAVVRPKSFGPSVRMRLGYL